MRKLRIANLIYLPCVSFLLIAVYSIFAVYIYDYGRFVPFNFYNGVMYSDIIWAICVYFFNSLCLGFGVYLSGVKTVGQHKMRTRQNMMPFIYLWVIIAWNNYDLSDLLMRHTYVVEARFKIVEKVGQVILPIVCFQLSKLNNWKSSFFVVLLYLLLFSLNSRALILLSFFLFLMQIRGGSPLRVLFLFAILIFSVSSPILLRSAPYQGLIGNFQSLGMFSLAQLSESIIFSLNYILSFPIASLIKSLSVAHLINDAFWLSITPLPSSMLGDLTVLNNAKFNDFAPISGMGFLIVKLNLGIFIFWLLFGFLYGFLLRLCPQGIGRLLISIVVFFACVLCTVYGLRNFFVLCIVISIITLLVTVIRTLFKMITTPHSVEI